MRIRNIYYSSHFSRVFKKLDPKMQQEAVKKEKMFRNDCFDARLRTHKLKGRLEGYWSFSVTHSYRILFEFINDKDVGFVDIGNHSIYQ